jgi:hypothetical protein
MAAWDPLLALHIAAGATGLVLGPLTMRATKQRGPHTRMGEAYHWVMLTVAATASAMAVLAWHRIWWFLPIAVFSYGNAFVGYVAAKRRPRGWLRFHIGGMGGSYIALVTALLVVNLGEALPIVWFVPTIVGSPIIAWVINEVDNGRRPRRRVRSADAPPAVAPLDAAPGGLLGQEPPGRQRHHVGAAACAVIGGDEVVADPQREGDHAARLDIVLVGAEGAEQRAHVIHSPVVDASQALGDRLLAPGPVADCEVGPQHLVAGEADREQPPQPGPGVPTPALDAVDHLVDGHPLPRVQHLLEQRTPAVEVPVEAALRDPERLRQRLDSDGVGAARGKGP